MVARYWDDLYQLESDLLIEAFGRAPREFPDFFPSLGQLLAFCSSVAKRRQANGAIRRLPEVSSAPGTITPEIRAAIDGVKSL